MVTTISEENNALRQELAEVSSQLANLLLTNDQHPPQVLAHLQASIRDLSDWLSAPIPVLPEAPAPTHNAHPPPPAPGPAPSRKGKERARVPPTSTSTSAEDPKYLIPFYNMKLGNAFSDTEKYARLFHHSYEAGEYRRSAYDVASFTPGHVHPDNDLSPSYTPAVLAPARVARPKAKSASNPPRNKLRVQYPLLLKRCHPPSQVPNEPFFCSSPVASPSLRRLSHCSNFP